MPFKIQLTFYNLNIDLKMMKTIAKISTSFLGAFAMNLANAQSDSISPIPKVSNEWRYEVTPYAWLPSIQGTIYLDITISDNSNSVELDF